MITRLTQLPQMCSWATMTLQLRTNSFRMRRVARADRIPLTNSHPHQEQYREVPGLNGSRGRYDVGSEGYSQAETVQILIRNQSVYLAKKANVRLLGFLSAVHS